MTNGNFGPRVQYARGRVRAQRRVVTKFRGWPPSPQMVTKRWRRRRIPVTPVPSLEHTTKETRPIMTRPTRATLLLAGGALAGVLALGAGTTLAGGGWH